ncbi:MAG: hypothetical protein V3W31_02335, partial [Thermodesulfobacteriota bacterium]
MIYTCPKCGHVIGVSESDARSAPGKDGEDRFWTCPVCTARIDADGHLLTDAPHDGPPDDSDDSVQHGGDVEETGLEPESPEALPSPEPPSEPPPKPDIAPDSVPHAPVKEDAAGGIECPGCGALNDASVARCACGYGPELQVVLPGNGPALEEVHPETEFVSPEVSGDAPVPEEAAGTNECPRCGALNDASVTRCACGYDFELRAALPGSASVLEDISP